jgi:drug/metabolite transporter (DMT)-like permease
MALSNATVIATPALNYRMLARKHYAAYGLICLIWGSTWGAIRLLVRDVPPLRAAAVRFFLAAVLLVLIVFTRGHRLTLTARQWRSLIILGFTMMALPYGLLFWAEYRVTSSMTAVLFSSCPLFVALFTPLLTHAHVPRRAVFAMLIAMGGISALFYTNLYASADLLLGGAAIMLAVVVSSWSAVFAKRELASVNPLWGTAIQFCVSAAALFFASLAFERGRPSDWNQTSLLALGFLTVFGSVVAFSIYYWLLSNMRAYQLSTVNLVVPIVAMAEGALLLREAVPLVMVGSAVLVLVSVAMVLRAEDEEVARLGLVVPEMGVTTDDVPK